MFFIVTGNDKIINGKPASDHQFPWVVHLQEVGSGHWYCTASLIAKNAVLTAAHCVEGGSKWDIVMGTNYPLETGDENGKFVVTSYKDIVHPEYNYPTTLHNDIALIILPEDVDVTNSKFGFVPRLRRISHWQVYFPVLA